MRLLFEYYAIVKKGSHASYLTALLPGSCLLKSIVNIIYIAEINKFLLDLDYS